MKHSPRREWEHLRASPFSEIVDILVQQQEALDRAKEQRNTLLLACREMNRLYAAEESGDPLVVQPHGCNLHAGMREVRAAIAEVERAK